MNIKKLSKVIAGITACICGIVSSNSLSYAAEDKQPALLKEKVEWSNDGNSTMTISDGVRYLNLNENVRVTQGTLVILGDSAVLEYDEPTRELIKVTVRGTPVRYAQELATNAGGEVSGNSNSIVLFSQNDTGETVVELTGNAHIESPDTTLNCAAIVYLPGLDLVPNTTGPCAGSFNQE
jgi:lipopolysaccharide transport protein LptA